MKTKVIIGLATLLIAAFVNAGPVVAVLLLPGTAPSALGGESPEIDFFHPRPPVAHAIIPFSTPEWSGSVDELVFKADTAAGIATGPLVFLYSIGITSGNGNAGIERFTASDFTGFSTYVEFEGAFCCIPPATADRSFSGNTVGFNFNFGDLGATGTYRGTGSALIWIATDATNWGAGKISLIDSQTQTLDAIGPTVVPEPSTLLLLGTGLAGLAMYGRKWGEK